MNEAKGIAFSSFEKNGWVISFTVRDGGRKEAEDSVLAVLDIINGVLEPEGCIPFRSYTNRWAEDTASSVAQAQAEEKLVESAEKLGGREIPEEHIYLGMKASKVEDIRENDSYDVLAQTYSYEGGGEGKEWVNFYNGSGEMAVAGHYYASSVGAKIFDGMFHWQPAQVDKAPIPGGDVLLYIVGTKGKKTEDIYQNIKAVEPA